MVGTMPREAVGQKGATPEHHLVLAVVAEPDVVSFPAFMPAVTPPAGSGGLNRLTTKSLVVSRITRRRGRSRHPDGMP
jgi:hypothetical protein